MICWMKVSICRVSSVLLVDRAIQTRRRLGVERNSWPLAHDAWARRSHDVSLSKKPAACCCRRARTFTEASSSGPHSRGKAPGETCGVLSRVPDELTKERNAQLFFFA